MAVQAQFGGLLLPPYAVEDQMRALKDYGVLLSAAQSELTCNVVAGGGAAAMPLPSRKRRRKEDEHRHYNVNVPLPGMGSLAADPTAAASTSGRAPADAAEVDALVRAECEQLRAGLEAARARQRRALLVLAAASGLARRAREAEARLEAARRRAAELDERVRLAAAEAQAWCGVARANEAVAAGMRATLDALLLRSSAAAGREGEGEGEAFGDSSEPGPDDAQSRCSCCYDVEATGTAAATASPLWNGRWACRACGEGEASVLLLPCRHMCLCKACEPRTDACPVCSGAKNASIHIAPS